MNSLNDNEFYENRHNNTIYSAETILSIVKKLNPNINSAIDLGCGVGTWLYVLEKQGINVVGVDGEWVQEKHLKINKSSFLTRDMSKSLKIEVNKTFDLAISLEVAEHLPKTSAEDFTRLLTSLSEHILFSAAIPFQGGIGHINEQNTNYWISLFEKSGYSCIDIIRKHIYNDEKIPFHYRQNILYFVKNSNSITIQQSAIDHIPAEKYLLSYTKLIHPGVKQSLYFLFKALKKKLQLS